MINEIKHIEINLGKVCNNRCLFCMTKRKDNFSFVSFHQVKDEIEKYSKRGFNSLGFLGGEPTIYPNIIDCINYAKDLGFNKIHLVSNGRRYSNMSFLRELIDSGANRFSVSIHSHIPEVEDYLTQVKGGFQQKLLGLKNLRTCQKNALIKNRISINAVINKLNFRNLNESLIFFNKMGFSEFRLNFMRPEGRAFYNFDELGIRYSDCAPIIYEILKTAEVLDFGVTLEGFPFCVLNKIKNQKMVMGELVDYFNLVLCFNSSNTINGKKTSKDVFLWKERRINKLKMKMQCCKECKHEYICEGVWKGYVEKNGQDEFKSIKGVS